MATNKKKAPVNPAPETQPDVEDEAQAPEPVSFSFCPLESQVQRCRTWYVKQTYEDKEKNVKASSKAKHTGNFPIVILTDSDGVALEHEGFTLCALPLKSYETTVNIETLSTKRRGTINRAGSHGAFEVTIQCSTRTGWNPDFAEVVKTEEFGVFHLSPNREETMKADADANKASKSLDSNLKTLVKNGSADDAMAKLEAMMAALKGQIAAEKTDAG